MQEILASMDQPLAFVLIAAFIAIATATWYSRKALTERPAVMFVLGVALCVLGSLPPLILPSFFELQRLYASALLIGLGLVVINVALSIGDPRERLRKKVAKLEERLTRQTAKNNERFEAIAHVREDARMADLHRLLRQQRLENQADEGIQREVNTREKIVILWERIDSLS